MLRVNAVVVFKSASSGSSYIQSVIYSQIQQLSLKVIQVILKRRFAL